MQDFPHFVDYIPIITTVFSALFFVRILKRYRLKPEAKYLLWWTIGVFTYGLGTLTESINAVAGWDMVNTKVWYVAGALLGGFPLAQGTVYLVLKKKLADYLTYFWVTYISIAAVCVFLSPVDLGLVTGRLTGEVFTWEWIRLFSIPVNSYSAIFLIGGAIYSAIKYRKLGRSHSRFLGNVYIAIGALLPGIGGGFARAGYVEVLFIAELLGLIFIFWGYSLMTDDEELSIHPNQAVYED